MSPSGNSSPTNLPQERMDAIANPSMTSLMKLVTTARLFSTHLPLDSTGRTIFDWAKLTADRFTFVGSSEVITYSHLYDQSVSKSPLDIHFSLGYIGKASVSTVATILHPSTGKPLLRNINHLVGIDKTTRRPKPLPDWWRDRHRPSAILKEPLKFPKLHLPDQAFPSKFRVVWTETDAYKHTSYMSYPHYCINALQNAITSGGVDAIWKEVVGRGLQSTRSTYFGESLENDDLTVHVWADSSCQRTAHFDIQKNGVCIFQSTFVYHE